MTSMVSTICLKETFTIQMAITSINMVLTNMVAITMVCTINQALGTKKNTTRDTKRFTVQRMRVPMKMTNITLKITSPRARAKMMNMKNLNNKLQPLPPPPPLKLLLKKTNLQRRKNQRIKMMDKLSERNLRPLLQRRNQRLLLLLLSRPVMRNTIVNNKKSMINTTLSRS